MKKKGFTLVEIIVCVGIIAVLGVASFVGVRFASNVIKENKLEQIEDKILAAAEVYIETNEEVKNKVSDEGVIIPLNVLQNEGLVNLDGIIDKNDDDYVVALLGSGSAGEECESTYIEGSWKIGSKTIYICTKSSGGGGSNLAIINPEAMSNSNKVSREPYYFTGSDPYNYVSHSGKSYRILYVDTDDSLILVGDELDGVFNSNQLQATEDGLGTNGSFTCDINTGKVKYVGNTSKVKVNGVAFIGAKDLINAKECYVSAFNIESSEVENCTHSGISMNTGWTCSVVGSATSGGTSITYSSWLEFKGTGHNSGGDKNFGYYYFRNTNGVYGNTNIAMIDDGTKYIIYSHKNNKCYNDYDDARYDTNSIPCEDVFKEVLYQKVHLKSCVKINSGVGSFENPYTLKSSC